MAEQQEPKPWEKLRARAADQSAATFVGQDGKIEVFAKDALGDAQQKALSARGLKPATPEDIEKRAKFLENSTTEAQTRGAIELGLNTATAGAIGKEDFGEGAEERRAALEQASPGVALGARIVGSAIPMAITGGAAGALGAGAAVVGAAEGVGAGLAEENAQAQWENRELNASNVAIAGIGGALFSAAIPAVLRRGSRALATADSAVAAAAGEVGENVGVQLEAKAAARATKSVDSLPPGPARDAVLVNNAPAHLERVQQEVTDVATRAPESLVKSDLDNATLKRLMPKDAPNQTQWATQTAEDLRVMAGKLEPVAPAPVAAAPAATAPVSLAGKSLEDLKALPIEGADDLARVAKLKEHPEFAATGKMPANDASGGITLVNDGGDLVLRDGRHRLTAAQELGRDTIHGRYVDGETGKVIFEGDIPLKAANDTEPVAPTAKRAGNGARIHEGLPEGWKPKDGSPIDIRDWNLDDFVPEKGRSRVVTRSHYGGSDRLSKYQRGLVDEIKEGQDFIQTGRLANAKNEPTFEIKPDNTITLHNGKTRMIAAREMGREDIYGRVVIKHGGKEQVVFEGMIPVGKGGKAAGSVGPPSPPSSPLAVGGGPGDLLRKAANDLLESKGALDTMQRASQALGELRAAGAPQSAIDALQKGVTDQSLFGRAAEAMADFDGAHARMPKAPLEGFDPANLSQASREQLTALAEALEDRAAARAKWDLGGGKDKVAERMLGDAKRIRDSMGLADDVAGAASRAAPAPAPAPVSAKAESPKKSFLKEAGQEAVEWIAERAIGHAIPGMGLAVKGARFLWGSLDASGQAAIKASARQLARGAMSAVERGSAAVGKVAPGALATFSEGFPGPAEAFAARSHMLAELQRDPTILPNAMAESFGDLPRENPKLFQDMAAHVMRATSYVTANLPAGIQTSIAYPRGIPPSQSALRDFAVVWNSAMNPETVVEAVGNGSATPAQVKALAVVEPGAYQSLLAAVTEEAANNYSQMPAQTKQWLDILFQSDGIAGPGQSWKAAQFIQQYEQRRPAGAGMKMDNLKPPSEQAPEARGLSAIAKGVTNRA
jgi:hypothetical protein